MVLGPGNLYLQLPKTAIMLPRSRPFDVRPVGIDRFLHSHTALPRISTFVNNFAQTH